jgi:transcriptional regulator with XRE-family HTH domain
MDFVRLGKILQRARINSGRTQAEIAILLGVTYQNVSSWERGKSKIDIESYVKLCGVYDINVTKPLEEAAQDMASLIMRPDDAIKSEGELLMMFRDLNYEGQKKVIVYVDDLVQSGKYIPDSYSYQLAEPAEAAASSPEELSIEAEAQTLEEQADAFAEQAAALAREQFLLERKKGSQASSANESGAALPFGASSNAG